MQLDVVVAAALEIFFADAALVTEYTYREKDANGEWKSAYFSDEDGMQLMLKSGYRTYSSQYTMYNNYLARNDGVDDGMSPLPAQASTRRAMPATCSVWNTTTRTRMNTDLL